jgi:hypothetical protein
MNTFFAIFITFTAVLINMSYTFETFRKHNVFAFTMFDSYCMHATYQEHTQTFFQLFLGAPQIGQELEVAGIKALQYSHGTISTSSLVGRLVALTI